jgi:hypothetical protein
MNYMKTNNQNPIVFGNLSLRDYLAAKAMQGIESNIGANKRTVEEIAERAYLMADAMLKQRNK